MTALGRLRVVVVVLVAFTLQRTVVTGIYLHGAQPDIMLLVVVLAGLAGGPERGAVVGFGVGLLVDLFLQTPFGLSALADTLVGFGVGMVRGALVEAGWWVNPVAAAVGSGAGVTLYALLGATMGQSQMLHDSLVWVVAVVALVNAVLAVPLATIMGWAMATSGPRASEVAGLVGRRSGVGGPVGRRSGVGR